MAIVGLQQQQTQVGRVRFGILVPTGTAGKMRPEKLDRLRFTSPFRNQIEKIAELYGGKVDPWQPQRGNAQWEVITNVAEVPVLVPPQDPAAGQWYEMWTKGGCLRRCDGETETISKKACLCLASGCAQEARDCKMHTRVRVMLEEVPGLGAWLVDTTSWYAAGELPGIASLLAMAQGAIPARLVLHQRTVTRQIKGKAETFNFAVPVLAVDEFTPGELVSGRLPELLAARRSAAIESQLQRIAIEAAPVDYSALITAAQSVPALHDLHKRAAAAGAVTDALRAEFTARKEAILAQESSATGRVVDSQVVESHVVDDGPSEVDRVWTDILAASPWTEADELERNFCEQVGCPSDEASLDQLREFLASLNTAMAGA